MATEAAEIVRDVNSNTYELRPNYNNKFRPAPVREAIHNILIDYLHGKEYKGEECTEWCRDITMLVKSRIKEMGYERYKFSVQAVIGEQRGEGVKMGCKCFWDSDTDNYAQAVYMNDSLFCVVACFAVFFY